MKRLHSDINEEDTIKGIVDLVLEAKFLTILNYLNIIKY